jgi:hypothetical protein
MQHTPCSSHVPNGWAKECYELLEYLDAHLGLKYKKWDHMESWCFRKLWEFPLDDVRGKSAQYYHIKNRVKYSKDTKAQLLWKKAKFKALAFPRSWKFAIKTLAFIYWNRVKNKYSNKLIYLEQIKEKFGTLRVYTSGPQYLWDEIQDKVRETEIKLSKKGVYWELKKDRA